MIRVAKPGAKIAIADEMKALYVKYLNIDKSRLIAPVYLVPKNMKDIRVKEIGKFFYILTFRKPWKLLNIFTISN